jgi:two-component system sensor histidine kinase KdpD
VDAALVTHALAILSAMRRPTASPSEPPSVTAQRDGEQIVIDVADRGPGIPFGDEESISRAFTERPTPDRSVSAWLLSRIARPRVEVRWTLTAENRPAGGARFTMRLPIVVR